MAEPAGSPEVTGTSPGTQGHTFTSCGLAMPPGLGGLSLPSRDTPRAVSCLPHHLSSISLPQDWCLPCAPQAQRPGGRAWARESQAWGGPHHSLPYRGTSESPFTSRPSFDLLWRGPADHISQLLGLPMGKARVLRPHPCLLVSLCRTRLAQGACVPWPARD